MLKVYLESPGARADLSIHPQAVRGQAMLFDSYAIHIDGTEDFTVTIHGSLAELEKVVKGMEDIINKIKEARRVE